jgi:molecular chaperone DnaJ
MRFRRSPRRTRCSADPAARRRHNSTLAEWEARPPVGPALTSAASWRPERVSLVAEPWAVRPSFEALMERLLRNVTGLGVPKAERPESLTLEIILEPEEVARGVRVPIGVPAVARCPRCGGAGHVWLFPCASCRQKGVVATERIVDVTIPARVRPGTVIDVPLQGLGIHNLYLCCLVRIAS